jgi:drug/metabolite transporter (DMT)-like permease
MMDLKLWHAFVLGAVLSWGVYVPILHEGQTNMGGERKTSSMRGFLCVGLAYFLTAVVIPLAYMFLRGEKIEFSAYGATFATLGGVFGAAGALCIILAIGAGGSPLYIAPLVFAGAPIVNAVVGLVWKTQEVPGPLFFVGIVLAAVGAFLVLYSKSDLDRKKAAHARAAAPAVAASAPVAGPPAAVVSPGEAKP